MTDYDDDDDDDGFMYQIELVGGPDDGTQLRVFHLYDTWDMAVTSRLFLFEDGPECRERYYLTTKVSKEGAALYYHEGFYGDEVLS